MEGANAIGLTSSYLGTNNKPKKKVKIDKVYKQKQVTNNLQDKQKAEKLFGMKFKGE